MIKTLSTITLALQQPIGFNGQSNFDTKILLFFSILMQIMRKTWWIDPYAAITNTAQYKLCGHVSSNTQFLSYHFLPLSITSYFVGISGGKIVGTA